MAFLLYSYLKASTGLREASRRAGKTPARKPIIPRIKATKIIILRETTGCSKRRAAIL